MQKILMFHFLRNSEMLRLYGRVFIMQQKQISIELEMEGGSFILKMVHFLGDSRHLLDFLNSCSCLSNLDIKFYKENTIPFSQWTWVELKLLRISNSSFIRQELSAMYENTYVRKCLEKVPVLHFVLK